MELTLLTPRLVLSPLVPGDLSLFLAMWTDKEVVRYICDPMTEAQVEAEMTQSTKRAGNGTIGVWSIRDRRSHHGYGTVALLPLPIEEDDTDWDLVSEGVPVNYEVEVGYALTREAWGRGIATEAASRLLRFGFECTDLEEIVAVIDPDNERSENVLKKIGLETTGERRAYASDCRGFKMTRAEWLETKSC